MLTNLKNNFDFYLRQRLRFESKVESTDAHLIQNKKLQTELVEFFELLNLEPLLCKLNKNKINIVDVGARDFFAGPVLYSIFHKSGLKFQIDGIETDAFRRFSNFKSRNDYAQYYCEQFENIFFHPLDFFDWQQNFDVCFLLHPFVYKKSALLWGLPKNFANIEALLNKITQRLNAGGLLVLSNPTEKEFGICFQILTQLGFETLENKIIWSPTKTSLQQKPRIGAVFQKKSQPDICLL